MLMRGKSVTQLDRGGDNHDLTQWLGHADARQVSDLPDALLKLKRSMTATGSGSETLRFGATRPRQVKDSPRISMAEPCAQDFLSAAVTWDRKTPAFRIAKRNPGTILRSLLDLEDLPRISTDPSSLNACVYLTKVRLSGAKNHQKKLPNCGKKVVPVAFRP